MTAFFFQGIRPIPPNFSKLPLRNALQAIIMKHTASESIFRK